MAERNLLVLKVSLSCAGTGVAAEQCEDTYYESIPLTSAVVTNSVNITTTGLCQVGAFNGYREVVALGYTAGITGM